MFIYCFSTEMAQSNPHHPNCNQNRRRESGISDNLRLFRERYSINVPFRLECLGCCFAYLRERNYTESPNLYVDRVCYSSDDLTLPGVIMRGDLASSFVRVPRKTGRQGQIATPPDINLGNMVVCPFADSRTYQIYSQATGALSVGFLAQARMESVAIQAVRPEELVEIYFNYADAALVELYREVHQLPSLSRPEVTGYLILFKPHEPKQKKKGHP